MVDHERSVSLIAGREADREAAMDTDLVVMLAHPIARGH
jgi:hypothetical protein